MAYGVVIGVVLVAVAAVWLACLVSVLTRRGGYRNANQLVWVLVLLLAGPVGAGLYLALGAGSAPAVSPELHEPVPGHRDRSEAIRQPWS